VGWGRRCRLIPFRFIWLLGMDMIGKLDMHVFRAYIKILSITLDIMKFSLLILFLRTFYGVPIIESLNSTQHSTRPTQHHRYPITMGYSSGKQKTFIKS
jgi:hypothetical protein